MLHRSVGVRLGVAALTIGGALMMSGALAGAADLFEDPGPYRAPPPYAERYEPPAAYDEPGYRHEGDRRPLPRDRYGENFDGCRVIQERRVDAYGREVVRRARVCDERTMRPRQAWRGPPPGGYDPRRDDGPRTYAAPPPPRDMGPGSDDDDDNDND